MNHPTPYDELVRDASPTAWPVVQNLHLVIRFPMGSYQAHTSAGSPEWPPHPSRIAAAILAGAHHTGRHIDLAEAMYTWEPPTLHTPPATPRDAPWSRWVVTDGYIEPDRDPHGVGHLHSDTPWQEKLSKSPELGMWVGEGTLTITYPHTNLHHDDLARFDDLLTAVTYLGRPTSPVTIERVEQVEPATTGDLWQPHPHGNHQLRIPTPAVLRSLDQAEQIRRHTPDPAAHPSTINRHARYQRIRLDHTPGQVHPPHRATIEEARTHTSWHATPHTPAHQITTITSLLPDGHHALPDYREHLDHGRPTHHLTGVLIHPPLTEPLWLPINGTLIETPAHLTPNTPARTRPLTDAWSTSDIWTTTAPIPNNPHTLRHDLEQLATHHGTTLLAAGLHDHPHTPHAPTTEHQPHLTHLTVQFTTPIPGPITLHNTLLTVLPPHQRTHQN